MADESATVLQILALTSQGISMDKLKFCLMFAAVSATTIIVSPRGYASGSQVSPMLACGSPTTTVLQGGFVVSRSCDGKRVSGIGSTIDDATANVGEIAQLLNYGVRCNYSTISGGPGAFIASFACSKPNDDGTIGRASSIGGIGTLMTDTGLNVLGFAQLYTASNGYRCNPSQTTAVPGGYVANFGCGFPSPDGIGRASTISGIGSNATDAGQNALGFAELGASIDLKCSTSATSIKVVGSAFEVRFGCNGRSVIGYGSTLTSAGRDALLQAQSL